MAQSEPRLKGGSLGRHAGLGMVWMLLSTGVGKTSSLIAQVVLGFLLVESDFGVYAAAMGLASLATVVRDGGTKQVLVQRGESHWERLAGPAFWLTCVISLSAAALLAAASGVLAFLPAQPDSAYADPRLVGVVLVIAASLALAPPATLFQARLAAELRFREVASLNAEAAVLRNASLILFASLGFGPMSFALPLVVGAVYVAARGFLLTRDNLFRRRPRRRAWGALFAKARWLILRAFARSVLLTGDYIALGFLIAVEVLGVYFFAYQVTLQVQVLISLNLQNVLFPSLARVAKEPARFVSAVLRATRVLSLLACAGALLLAVLYEPLQRMIWGDKWAATVPAVQAMAVFFPFRMLFNVLNSALLARGEYRRVFLLTIAAGVGLVGVAIVAGTMLETAGEIAFAIAIYFGVGVTSLVIIGLRSVGVPVGAFLASVLPAWLLGLASAGAATSVLLSGLDQAHPALAALGAGVVFVACYTVGARLFLASIIREATSVVPARLARPIEKMLLLPRASAGGRDG